MSIKNKSIRCISCRFARPDASASRCGWIAYECGNCESDYYGYLLNVDKEGNQKSKITWSGCSFGVRRASR